MGMIGKTSSKYHWDLSLGDRTAVAKNIGRISHEIEALIEKKVAFRTPTQLVTFEQRSWELRNK
jgi:hypothetical protein